MTKYNFDRVFERRHTESVKWSRYEADVLPLWVADMDFVSPQPVIEALQARVAQGIFGYPEIPDELRQAVVDRLADLYGWQVLPEHLIFTPGVVSAFTLAARALVTSEEGILVQPPVYHPILSVAERVGVRSINSELVRQPDGSYTIDWDDFETAAASGARMFILCNPHNPAGKVFRREEIERLAEICLRHNVLMCSDEIHAELIFSGNKHVPLACLDDEIAQNSITFIAPSKTFNLPGLKCSLVIIPNDSLRRRYTRYAAGLVLGANILGMTAAQAAYLHGDDWLRAVMAYLEDNRDYTWEYVDRELPGVKMWKPEGTYLAWLDCRKAGIPGDPFDFFLENARVALESGPKFGPGGEGFVRLNFGCPRPILEQALGRMKEALQSLH